jgi:hypothetical protein
MVVVEQQRRGRAVVFGLIALGLAAAALAVWWWTRASTGSAAANRRIPGQRDHVVVEVLNTTRALGLARAATRTLRDAGIDVVYFGSDSGAVADSTQILLRRGSAGAATRVARALGVGSVRDLPDSGRLVDVTVRLGRDFAAQVAAQHP